MSKRLKLVRAAVSSLLSSALLIQMRLASKCGVPCCPTRCPAVARPLPCAPRRAPAFTSRPPARLAASAFDNFADDDQEASLELDDWQARPLLAPRSAFSSRSRLSTGGATEGGAGSRAA